MAGADAFGAVLLPAVAVVVVVVVGVVDAVDAALVAPPWPVMAARKVTASLVASAFFK